MFLKDNAPGYLHAWVNYAVCALILLGLLAASAYPGGPEAFVAAYGPTAGRVFHGADYLGGAPGWLSLLLAPFLTMNWVTGLLSLLILWQFGDNIEYVCGRPRYVLFYLGCGVAGTLFQLGFTSTPETVAAGAHCAASGAALAYLLCFPRARVTLLTYIRPYSLDHALAGDWGYSLRNISAAWYIGGIIAMSALWMGLMLSVGGYADAWCIQYSFGTIGGALAGSGLLYLLEVPGRRPGRDEATSSDPLTDPWVGDEGDAGDGEARGAPSLGAELARLRQGPAGRRHQLMLAAQEAFDDRYAAGLIERGEFKAAYAHCADMLDLATRASDDRRIRGYRRLLQQLEELHQQQLAQRRAARAVDGAVAPHDQHLQAAIDAAHGIGSMAPDPYGLADTPRGTRQH